MNEFVPSPDRIKEILQSSKVIAVVGLSDNINRLSNMIGKFLKARGYKVIPVNPKYETVLGLKSYPSLLDIPDDVDIVDFPKIRGSGRNCKGGHTRGCQSGLDAGRGHKRKCRKKSKRSRLRSDNGQMYLQGIQ